MLQKQHVSFRKNRSFGGKGQPKSRWEKRLGTKDPLVTWFKPPKRPTWLSDHQFRLLPSSLVLREIAYRVKVPGFRTEEVVLVTTLTDCEQFPASELEALYGKRWSIETNFRHLKTTMGMEVLRCKTVDGVLRELYVYCLVYNLIRTIMLEAGIRLGQHHSRLSFIDALRALIPACHGVSVDSHIVAPERPHRFEWRAKKRRAKQYDLLNKPRNIWRMEALRA